MRLYPNLFRSGRLSGVNLERLGLLGACFENYQGLQTSVFFGKCFVCLAIEYRQFGAVMEDYLHQRVYQEVILAYLEKLT